MTLLRKTLFVGLSFLCASAFAATEGEDYVKLAQPLPNAQGTLTKVFSYDCPHCYKFDRTVDPKLLPYVEKDLGLKFVPMHLETRATYGVAATEFFIYCMQKDKAAGRAYDSEDSLFRKAKDFLYDQYNLMEERWKGGEKDFLAALAKATGVSLADFEKVRNTPQIQDVRNAWKVSYDIAKIQGIPGYIVNGKYLVKVQALRSRDAMKDLVKELKDLP